MSPRSYVLNSLAFVFTLLMAAGPASAQALQVDADLTMQSYYGSMMPGPAVRAGLLLSDRLAIESGAMFFIALKTADNYSYTGGFRVPLEVAWYFDEATEQALVPSVRLGASYGQDTMHYTSSDGPTTTTAEATTRSATGTLLGGVTYFVSKGLGLSAQAGPVYARTFGNQGLPGLSMGPSRQTLSAEYRIGFVFRS